jgi:integrase
VYFLQPWGDLFFSLFREYRKYYPLDNQHPYLFISHSSREYGQMWTIGALQEAHKEALKSIGHTQSKKNGTNPHGLRHRYGQSLTDLGESPLVIQACMHHRDLSSQLVYTKPTPSKINAALNAVHLKTSNVNESILSTTARAPDNLAEDLLKRHMSDPAGLFTVTGLGLHSDILEKPNAGL